jgi:hypothetical protein
MKDNTIANNVFMNAGSSTNQVKFIDLATTQTNYTIQNNSYHKTSGSTIGCWFTDDSSWFEDNASVADPDVVDYTTGNFHLNIGSPCVDAGTDNFTVTTDYDGNNRPQNTYYDIGAYEYTGGGGGGGPVLYQTTIRKNGVDYFIFMGQNTSAYWVWYNISAMRESTEYIALWNHSGNWTYFYGDRINSNNFSVHTYDIIRTYMDDSASTYTFYTENNSDIDYAAYEAARTVTLTFTTTGYNYTGYTRSAGTSLSAINTSLALLDGYAVGVWDETTYSWDWWISGFTISDTAVSQYSIVITKTPSTKTWVQ